MLAGREHWKWFMDKNRQYKSEMERRFFQIIENPPAPSEELLAMVNKYGEFAQD